MRQSLKAAGSIFNIRVCLQRYKDEVPPETQSYNVSQKDLLMMLDYTEYAWHALEEIESQIDKLIGAISMRDKI